MTRPQIFCLLILMIFSGISLPTNQSLILIKTIIPDVIDDFGQFYIKIDGIYTSGSDQIYHFDYYGKLLNKIGGKGQGPGEFGLLRDFFISPDRIIVAGQNKIAIFRKSGELKREIKHIRNPIQRIFELKKKIFTWELHFDISKEKKSIKQILRLVDILNDNKLISFPDESRIKAYHPKRGITPFPWFVAPFYNRAVVLMGGDKKLRIFFTRKKYFLHYKNSKFHKITIKYDFQVKKVKEKDKNIFFKQISSVNKMPLPKKTINSVIFPKTKEFFYGTISWGNNFALILEDHFLLLNTEGKYISKVFFPKEMTIENNHHNLVFLERKLDVYQNHLYYSDLDNECLKVFKIN